jgi:hypothetical protein
MIEGMNCRTKTCFLAGMMVTMLLALPALAAASEGHASASGAAGPEVAVPIPVNPVWVSQLLLVVVWIVVAAVLLGPLVLHFRLLPRTTQLFADDHGAHDATADHAAPATHH